MKAAVLLLTLMSVTLIARADWEPMGSGPAQSTLYKSAGAPERTAGLRSHSEPLPERFGVPGTHLECLTVPRVRSMAYLEGGRPRAAKCKMRLPEALKPL